MQKAVTTPAIPIPPTRSTVRSFGDAISPTETLRGMKAGESFLVDDKRGRAIVVSAAYRLDISVTTAKEGGRFRIWRVA